ncbi:hypothetical protein EMCRGX_G033323 [Ephydatia muelleri]
MSPSDVSSPLVVMATSSSITVTGGLCSPARGPQTTIFNVQAQQMTLQTVVTGLQPVTTYLVYIYIHVAASTVGGQGVGPPAAISTLQFVQSPVVVSEGTHFLHLEWLPPAQPNGATVVYSGANLQATVTGLSTSSVWWLTTLAAPPRAMQAHSPLFGPLQFSLYCNGALVGVLPLTVISYNTTGLLPFTLYMYMSSSHAHRHCTPVGTWCLASSVLQPACPDPPVHCDSNLFSKRTALLGDRLHDPDDIVISIFINKIINPDKSFGSLVSTPLNMPRPYTVIP